MKSDIMPVMAREQLQIDASKKAKNQIKSVAYREGLSMRELVLRSIAKTWPELKDVIEDEL